MSDAVENFAKMFGDLRQRVWLSETSEPETIPARVRFMEQRQEVYDDSVAAAMAFVDALRLEFAGESIALPAPTQDTPAPKLSKGVIHINDGVATVTAVTQPMPEKTRLIRILETFQPHTMFTNIGGMRGQLFNACVHEDGGATFDANSYDKIAAWYAGAGEYELVDPSDTSKVRAGDRVRTIEPYQRTLEDVFTVRYLAPESHGMACVVDASFEGLRYRHPNSFTLVSSDTPLG